MVETKQITPSWWILDSFPMRCLKALLRIVLILFNNVFAITAYVVWLAVLWPVWSLRPLLYWEFEGKMFRWLIVQVSYWMHTANYKLLETGDTLSQVVDDEAILICNHQSTGDVPVLFYALQAKGNELGCLMWIMDYIFKFTNFGIVSAFHGDFFIFQGQGEKVRMQTTRSLRQHLHTHFWPRMRKWVIVFPEGGFLRKRRPRSQAYARKNDLPILEHVALPRIGAMETILGILHPATVKGKSYHFRDRVTEKRPLKWIVDVTIGYPKGEPISLLNVVTAWSEPCEVAIHYRKFPIHEVPTAGNELTTWLYERFQEKEKLLDEFYKTGHFPFDQSIESHKPRHVTLSTAWVVLLHVGFLASFLVQCYVIRSVWGYLQGPHISG